MKTGQYTSRILRVNDQEKTVKLSVIVPVYNMAADDKLTYCLDSIVAQTVSDMEIIAVDDASTDDSPEILKEYESRYPGMFKAILSPVNRKQGGARNIGLKEAKGEWIGFIDSDDWIKPDFYESLIKKGEETGADVVGCGYSIVDHHTFKTGRVINDIVPEQTGVMTSEKRKCFLKNSGSMVMKVYRSSLIRDNDLTFPEGIFYEDNCAGPVWSMYYKHFEYINRPMYYYYQHGLSTVHTITADRCKDRTKAAELMLSELKRRGFYNDYRDVIESIFTTTFFVNTLFSYMRIKGGRKMSFVSYLKQRMKEEFPDFRENENYGKYMDEEQKKYVDILMGSTLRFYVQYSLLWFYRDLRLGNR